MAEQFSQSEIDDLIKSGFEAASEEAPAETGGARNQDTWGSPGKGKYIRSPKPPEFRFPRMYRSPLVKKENIVFNPAPDSKDMAGTEKIVVRTLSNFLEFMQNKKQPAKTKSIDKR